MDRIRLVPGEVCLWGKQTIIIKSLELDLGKVWSELVGLNDSKLLDIRELRPLPAEREKTTSVSIQYKQDLSEPKDENGVKPREK